MILLEHDSTHALNKYRGDPANRSENTQICENHCPPTQKPYSIVSVKKI